MHGRLFTLLIAAIVLAAVRPASSQTPPAIGIYHDAGGTQCNLVDAPGFVDLYVVATGDVGLYAVSFAAPRPACFDATYIRDDLVYPLALGNSQTGVSVPFTYCQARVHVLTMVFFSNGGTEPCCGYPIYAHPGSASGQIEFVDCGFEMVTGVTLDHTINGDASCFCGIDPPPAIPSKPYPGDDSWELPVTGHLSWSSRDPDGDAVSYDVYLGADPDPQRVAVDHPDTVFTPDILEFDTQYYWKVVARDEKGMESTGPLWSFHTRAWSPEQLVVATIDDRCELANNDTVVVDVQLVDTGIPIDDGGFELSYDTTTLTLIGCKRGDLTADWVQFECQEVTTGVRIAGAGAVPIAPGSNGVFARLEFLSSCCAVESTTVFPLCPDSVTGDLRSLYRECSEYTCAVYQADGDVNGDGAATPGDALCALESYLSFPEPPLSGCAAPGWDIRSDVDCGGAITPADALCIFRNWLDESCALCAFAPSVAVRAALTPPDVVPVDVREVDGGWVLVLGFDRIERLDAFGLDIRFDPDELELAALAGATLTDGFDALRSGSVAGGWSRVGGYTTHAVAARGEAALELRLRPVGDATGGSVTIGGFVDALTGAADVTVVLGSGGPVATAPTRYVLHQNHPNPFNPATTIRYEIPDGARAVPVHLAVYTVDGRRVAVLENTRRDGGVWEAPWDGTGDGGVHVASGVYFYVLRAGPATLTRKMVVLK